jgi:hypothetical protein
MLHISQIPLSQLRILPEVQSRVTLDPNIIADYRDVILAEREAANAEHRAATYQFKEPFLAVQDDDGFIIADGFHRAAAYWKQMFDPVIKFFCPLHDTLHDER